MKKSFEILAAALCSMALASCAKEIAQPQDPQVSQDRNGLVSIAISVNAGSKVTLDDATPTWQEGDQIAVWDGADVRIFTFQSGNTFTGEVQEGTTEVKVAFPCYTFCNAGEFMPVIPDEQDIASGEIVNSNALAMTGAGSISSTIELSNAGSLVKFTVAEGTQKVILHTGHKDKYIASVFPKVTVNLPGTAGTYYATILPGTYDGIHVFSYDGSAWTVKDGTATLELAAGAGKNLGTVTGGAACALITNGEELKEFLASATTSAYVMEDLDLSGITLASAESFASSLVFDGQDYGIGNWTSDGVSLIGTNAGTVKNLNIESSCSVAPTTGDFGIIIKTNDGQVLGCSNASDVSVTVADVAPQYIFGTIAGRNNLYMENCSNSGNVTFTFKNGYSGIQYIGGITGIVGSPQDAVRMKGCSNSGNLSIVCEAGTQKTTELGGIFGATGVNAGSSTVTSDYTKYYGEILSCSNSGSITSTTCGGTGGYPRTGGISGYGECSYTSCTNTGAISFSAKPTTPTSAPATAGITGVMAGPSTAKDCLNEGEISQSGMFGNASNSYSAALALCNAAAAAGCIAVAGDKTVLMDNCDNTGTVNANTCMNTTAGSSAHQGGIVAYARCQVKNCDTSNGDLNFTSSAASLYQGGIVGRSLNTSAESIVNCHCSSAFYPSVDIHAYTKDATFYIYTGGVAGYAAGDISDCSLESRITTAFVNSNPQNGKVNEFRFGGIVAQAAGNVTDCTLTSDARIFLNHDYKLYAGGVIGYLSAAKIVSGCTNNADVDINNSYDGNAGIKQTWFGGIVGWTNASGFTITGCTNYGDIDTYGGNNTAFNYYGGIYGSYNTGAASNIISDCANYGNISSTSGSKIRIGGIAGSMNATVTNVINTGNISMRGGASGSRAGGIVGYTGRSITGGSTSGTVTASDNGSSSCAGGICGDMGNSVVFSDFTINSQVTGNDANDVAGIVAGSYYLEGNTFVLGAEGKPLTIRSTSSLNGVTVSATPADSDLVGTINTGTLTRTNLVID